MNVHELQQATQAHSDLKQFRDKAQAVAEMEITSVTLTQIGNRGNDGTILTLYPSGRGLVASIGFPEELQDIVTKAFKLWLEDQIQEQVRLLKELGVSV